jgi:hypothetical protein
MSEGGHEPEQGVHEGSGGHAVGRAAPGVRRNLELKAR